MPDREVKTIHPTTINHIGFMAPDYDIRGQAS
jgi:hypothetical protein